MTIKTVIWFTCGGAFAALYANKVQGFHFLRKPHRLLLTTLLGLAVGYKVSNFEDNYESYILKAKQENPLAPVHPRSSLLTYQAMVRQKQEEQSEGNFDISEEEEEEDDD